MFLAAHTTHTASVRTFSECHMQTTSSTPSFVMFVSLFRDFSAGTYVKLFISIIIQLIYEYNPLSCNRRTWRKCVFVSFNQLFVDFISFSSSPLRSLAIHWALAHPHTLEWNMNEVCECARRSFKFLAHMLNLLALWVEKLYQITIFIRHEFIMHQKWVRNWTTATHMCVLALKITS